MQSLRELDEVGVASTIAGVGGVMHIWMGDRYRRDTVSLFAPQLSIERT